MWLRVCGLLLALTTLSACARFNPQTFAALDQAAHAIVVSFDARPSLPAFQPLRQAFGTALSDTRPRVRSQRERTLLADYEAADVRLTDMVTVWDGLTSGGEEMLPLTRPLAEQLKTRYDLGVNTNEPPSIYANEALVALRDDIKKRLTDASDALHR